MHIPSSQSSASTKSQPPPPFEASSPSSSSSSSENCCFVATLSKLSDDSASVEVVELLSPPRLFCFIENFGIGPATSFVRLWCFVLWQRRMRKSRSSGARLTAFLVEYQDKSFVSRNNIVWTELPTSSCTLMYITISGFLISTIACWYKNIIPFRPRHEASWLMKYWAVGQL